MTNDSNKPISTFDEICHLTIETMRRMDMETLMQLRKQAVREFDRTRLSRGCIELALSLKTQDQERATREADQNQQSLLDD